MYLEEYYLLKSNVLLIDKILSKTFFLFTAINFNLTYIIKLKLKKSNIIFILLLLVLTFLNSYVFKLKYNFIITLTTLYDIFEFLNRLILILLPSNIYNKKLFFSNYFNLNSLNYFFKQFPLIFEIDTLIKYNKYYFKILNKIESKLIINIPFLNILHKESICHILKLPISIK